jgi:hypothetical protein
MDQWKRSSKDSASSFGLAPRRMYVMPTLTQPVVESWTLVRVTPAFQPRSGRLGREPGEYPAAMLRWWYADFPWPLLTERGRAMLSRATKRCRARHTDNEAKTNNLLQGRMPLSMASSRLIGERSFCCTGQVRANWRMRASAAAGERRGLGRRGLRSRRADG